MSKHIIIQGIPEATFTKFAGAEASEYGASLQITVGERFIQLATAQVQELIEMLNLEWGEKGNEREKWR